MCASRFLFGAATRFSQILMVYPGTQRNGSRMVDECSNASRGQSQRWTTDLLGASTCLHLHARPMRGSTAAATSESDITTPRTHMAAQAGCCRSLFSNLLQTTSWDNVGIYLLYSFVLCRPGHVSLFLLVLFQGALKLQGSNCKAGERREHPSRHRHRLYLI